MSGIAPLKTLKYLALGLAALVVLLTTVVYGVSTYGSIGITPFKLPASTSPLTRRPLNAAVISLRPADARIVTGPTMAVIKSSMIHSPVSFMARTLRVAMVVSPPSSLIWTMFGQFVTASPAMEERSR